MPIKTVSIDVPYSEKLLELSRGDYSNFSTDLEITWDGGDTHVHLENECLTEFFSKLKELFPEHFGEEFPKLRAERDKYLKALNLIKIALEMLER